MAKRLLIAAGESADTVEELPLEGREKERERPRRPQHQVTPKLAQPRFNFEPLTALLLSRESDTPFASAFRAKQKRELLPQSGGFEGLFLRPVLPAPRDLSVPDRVDAGVGQIGLDAAQLGPSHEPQDGNA